MKFNSILLSIALLTSASPAFSKEVTCNFTSWKGATSEEASISWVGTGFIADAKKARVRKVYNGNKQAWTKVTVKKTNKFTTFVYRTKNEANDKGEKVDRRYGYRVYETGKCNVTFTTQKYTPIIATGRLN